MRGQKQQQASKSPPWTSLPEGECLHERTFVFEREETQQSSIVDIAIPAQGEEVDLAAFFLVHCPLHAHTVSVYDPDVNAFIPLARMGADRSGVIPRRMLQPRIVMVRFRRRELEGSESDSGAESGREGREKKDRSRERSIGEAIELVKRWRMVHLDSSKSGLRKMSLAEAARAIGISKKTLDDYYYQLRLGEFYCFDFSNNLGELVGVLRAYVKAFRPGREDKGKNLRHPKNLKIIESFELDLPAVLVPSSPMLEQLHSPSSFKSLPVEGEAFESQSGSFIKDVMQSHEDRFFKNFEFLLDDPNDPFLEIDRNFKKKPFDDSSNDFFFF